MQTEYFIPRLKGPILKSDLGPGERLLMAFLSGLCSRQECYAGNKLLGEVIGVTSMNGVSTLLKRLAKRELITRTGPRHSRRINLTDAGWALLGGRSGAGEEDVAPSPPPTTPEPKTAKEKKINPTIEEHAKRELPDFIPRDLWTEFVEMKHREHGPFSEAAAKGVVSKITRLRGDGHCPIKLLRLATESCWQSVHPDDKQTRRGIGSGRSAVMPGRRPRMTGGAI